jgi:hypothetical protein
VRRQNKKLAADVKTEALLRQAAANRVREVQHELDMERIKCRSRFVSRVSD